MTVQAAPARRRTTKRDLDRGAQSSDVGEPSASDSHEAGTDAAIDGRGPTLERSIGWLLMMLGFLIGSRTISDNSFFTHFATGNVILSDGSVPTGDVFSYTAPGQPWTVQSWFASVWYRGIYDIAGLGALRIANGLLVMVLMGTLWRLTSSARTLFPRVLLCGLGVSVGAMMWAPRPLVFGLVCFALFIEVVENPRRPLWLLVPIMWLWVNTHGSFPLAFVFLGAIGVGHLVDTRRFHSRDVQLGFWLIGGTLAGALNPIGIRLLTFPFELLSKREALEDVSEWMSPSFERPSEWAFVGLLFVLIISAKLGASWRHLLPAFGFFITGLLAVRNINPAIVVMIACAAPALGSLPGTLDGSARGVASRGVAALSLAMVALVGVLALSTPGIDYEKFPVLEVDWLEERGLVAQPGVNLVHRDTTGNYLELRYGRDARVFFDDRFDMYPQQVIDDHATLYFGGDFAEILDRYEADAVLWEAESDLGEWLDDPANGWEVGFEGETYLVAVRS